VIKEDEVMMIPDVGPNKDARQDDEKKDKAHDPAKWKSLFMIIHMRT
jgi:hypothetical protein